MIWQDYELDNVVLKTGEPLKLWQTERGLVEIDKDALSVAVIADGRVRGYVLHGQGRLVLDTIVETEEGAFGKPVERKLSEPFLMLGDIEGAGLHLGAASDEDLARTGYRNQKEFTTTAEDLFYRVLKRRRMHGFHYCGGREGLVFAFPNKVGRLDYLVTRGVKIVYRASNMTFVSNERNLVLKSPEQTVLSHNGKLCIVRS
jgi:hypothetical protein